MTKPESNFGFFEGAMAGLSREHKREDFKFFDWDKAARYIKENNIKNAQAGLEGDWDYTGGSIFTDGKMDLDSYTYLESSWAVPHLYDQDNDVMIECYVTPDENTNKWNSDTRWPDSAVKILNE